MGFGSYEEGDGAEDSGTEDVDEEEIMEINTTRKQGEATTEFEDKTVEDLLEEL